MTSSTVSRKTDRTVIVLAVVGVMFFAIGLSMHIAVVAQGLDVSFKGIGFWVAMLGVFFIGLLALSKIGGKKTQ